MGIRKARLEVHLLENNVIMLLYFIYLEERNYANVMLSFAICHIIFPCRKAHLNNLL